MSEFQRIIKYLAIAFAIFLVLGIVSGIMSLTSSFDNFFDSDNNITDKLKGIDISKNVNILDVDVKGANIVLKEGNIFKAETDSKNINIEQDQNKLHVTQKKYNLFDINKNNLIIYIPSGFIFDGVSIESGAGKIDIDSLTTRKLYFDLGAGKVDIKNLNVSQDAKIEGGAGSISILSGSINDLDLDMGAGKLELTSRILGNSKIDAGIGSIQMNLIGTKDEYKIKIDKGIGSTSINDESISDNTYYGEGNNIIDIEGGIGAIKVKLIDYEG